MTLVLAAVVGPACIDFSALPYAGPDGGSSTDASTASAVDGASTPLVAACRQCLTAGACASKAKACLANTLCAAVTECLTEQSCWGQINLADTANLPPCVSTCTAQSGVTSLVSPSTLLAVPLFQCSTAADGCQSVCAAVADQ
jgi:hypothetical protein